jgi:translation initiation factor 1 (eIF-1/SUI1)
MAKNSKKIDVSADQGALRDNPFAALGGMVSGQDLPDAKVVEESVTAEILYKVKQPYSVGRTRKGGWPVRREKRGAGKTVTLIQQVSGDTKALLKALQKQLGVGGKIDGDVIQLQGDHVGVVEKFLDDAFQN